MLGFTKRTNSAALAFLVAGSCWFVIGTIYGLFSAIHLLNPEFFSNIPFLVFGRTRPSHVNTVIFAFLAQVLIGVGLYYTPALLRTRLWSERLGWLAWLTWNLTVLSGPVTFAFGWSQGREYCEYVYPADVLFMLTMLLLIVNVVMTIINRQEKALYVAIWYFTATFLWTAGTYPIGNVMWHPATGALPGIVDEILLWYWGHNLPGLVLTPLATGAAFFVIPRLTGGPLYSHTLSLIGFWALVAIYTHIGGHHILQAPIPNWLKVMSVVDSGAMVIPVFTVLINLWATTRGRAGRVWSDPAGLWVIVGTIWYLFTCIQGPVQALPMLQRVTHFNNWTVGHSHIAVLGFGGYIAIGALWYTLPFVARRKIWSRRLIWLQFGLVTVGLTGFFVVLTIVGLIQGQSWYNGEVVYRTLSMMPPYMGLRLMFGPFIITGAIVGLVNVIMTLRRGEPFEPQPAEEAEI